MMRDPDTEGRRPPQVRKLYRKRKLGCSLLVQSTHVPYPIALRSRSRAALHARRTIHASASSPAAGTCG